MKLAILVSGVLAFFATSSFDWSFAPVVRHDIDRIVIDPGHGGKDPGAHGSKTNEKELVLKIAKKVKALFDNDKHMKGELTRDSDDFIGLYDRAGFANKRQADLFVSIHINANNSSKPHGSETYAMGLHKTDANLNVMKRENSTILMEDNHQEKYNGFDPKSEEALIMFKLQQHAYLKQSLALAKRIEGKFKENTKRVSRGVKQAGFLVLWKTSMPSVLVECGFISNPSDEKFLSSEEGQNHLAQSIYEAVKEYREQNS